MSGPIVKVEIRPIACATEPDAHALWLVVEQQSFQISGGAGFDDKEHAEWMADQLRHALAKITRGVPEGMVLVPVEPTRAMLDAAAQVVFESAGQVWCGDGLAQDWVRETQQRCFAAMVAEVLTNA